MTRWTGARAGVQMGGTDREGGMGSTEATGGTGRRDRGREVREKSEGREDERNRKSGKGGTLDCT